MSQGLPGANTLASFAFLSAKKKKSEIILTTGAESISFFSLSLKLQIALGAFFVHGTLIRVV